MPRFLVSYEVEADEREVLESSPEEGESLSVLPIKGDKTDHYVVPMGHKVLVRLANGQYVLAQISGWFIGEPMWTDAKYIQCPDELVMSAHEISLVKRV